MTKRRTYGDGCAAAQALDLVGERWALLVVRELLFGPKRFTDLRAGMPNASPNVLAQRLRELEEAGIVRRYRLGPPIRAQVYELTEWGHDLEPVLTHLGRWGRRSPLRDTGAGLSVDSLMLALHSHFDTTADPDLTATLVLDLDEDRFVVRIAAGNVHITRGAAETPDAVMRTDIDTLSTLVLRGGRLQDALDTHRIKLTGDRSLVLRLFAAVAAEAAPAAAAN